MTSDPSSAVLSTPLRAHTHQELAEVRSKLPLQADRVMAVTLAAINCLACAVHEHARIGVRTAHPGLGQYHWMQPLWMGLFISLEWMCNGDRCGRGSEPVHLTFRVMIQSVMISTLQLNIIDDCSRNPINQSVVDDRARHLESKQDSNESHAVDTVMIRSKHHR